MSQPITLQHDAHAAQETYAKTLFGFWIYIMTDCILFSSLFAAYLVLHGGTFGGPSSKDLFDMSYALGETLILLASSFTCGLIMMAAQKNKRSHVLFWFAVTLALGLSFLGMELTEFTRFVEQGASWRRSGFLSSFFTLVGTHGCHISVGCLWMVVLGAQVAFRGINPHFMRRLACFKLFWHFLDIVWIFIFTIVYLMGVIDYA